MDVVHSREVPPRRTWWRSQWLPAALAVAPTLLTVWAASPPGGYFEIATMAFTGWLVTGLLWLTATVRAARALPRPRRGHLGALWPSLLFPVLFVGISLLASSGVISRVMFEMHRPGLERLAADVAAAPNQQLMDQRVGLFAVSHARTDRTTGCTTIDIHGTGFLNSRGFAYCPDRPPVDTARGGDGTTYERISGAWYVFTFVW